MGVGSPGYRVPLSDRQHLEEARRHLGYVIESAEQRGPLTRTVDLRNVDREIGMILQGWRRKDAHETRH